MWYNEPMRPHKQEILRRLRTLKPQLRQEGIEELALFGSFATDKASVYSDIDIAIKMDRNVVRKEGAYGYLERLERIKKLLRRHLHRPVDIFDLNSASPYKAQIEAEMIRV